MLFSMGVPLEWRAQKTLMLEVLWCLAMCRTRWNHQIHCCKVSCGPIVESTQMHLSYTSSSYTCLDPIRPLDRGFWQLPPLPLGSQLRKMSANGCRQWTSGRWDHRSHPGRDQ